MTHKEILELVEELNSKLTSDQMEELIFRLFQKTPESSQWTLLSEIGDELNVQYIG